MQETSNSYVLDAVSEFVRSLVYATPEITDAITLATAVSHSVDAFTTVPSVLITSDEPESGKSTVLDAARLLGYNAWDADDATSHAVRSKFNEVEGTTAKRVLMIVDELSKIFGESGLNGRQHPVYPILVKRYRKVAQVAISVGRQTEDKSCYGVSFMAGLKNACPVDLRSRCIRINMTPMPEGHKVEDALDPSVEAEGARLNVNLHGWVTGCSPMITAMAINGLRNVHPKLVKRRKQVWGPLFAVAKVAGGSWPERCLRAFSALALGQDDKPQMTPVQELALDVAAWLETEGIERFTNREVMDYLYSLNNPLYAAQDEEHFMKLLSKALGPTTAVRFPEGLKKGRYSKPITVMAESLREMFMPMTDDEEDDTAFLTEMGDEILEEGSPYDEEVVTPVTPSEGATTPVVTSVTPVTPSKVCNDVTPKSNAFVIDPDRLDAIHALLNRGSGAHRIGKDSS